MILPAVYGKKSCVAVMARKNTKFRRAIKIERRVALALWRLATGSSYRNVSKVFGVGMLHENTDFDISIHCKLALVRCYQTLHGNNQHILCSQLENYFGHSFFLLYVFSCLFPPKGLLKIRAHFKHVFISCA